MEKAREGIGRVPVLFKMATEALLEEIGMSPLPVALQLA